MVSDQEIRRTRRTARRPPECPAAWTRSWPPTPLHQLLRIPLDRRKCPLGYPQFQPLQPRLSASGALGSLALFSSGHAAPNRPDAGEPPLRCAASGCPNAGDHAHIHALLDQPFPGMNACRNTEDFRCSHRQKFGIASQSPHLVGIAYHRDRSQSSAICGLTGYGILGRILPRIPLPARELQCALARAAVVIPSPRRVGLHEFPAAYRALHPRLGGE